jgi:hypothetical protein
VLNPANDAKKKYQACQGNEKPFDNLDNSDFFTLLLFLFWFLPWISTHLIITNE